MLLIILSPDVPCTIFFGHCILTGDTLVTIMWKDTFDRTSINSFAGNSRSRWTTLGEVSKYSRQLPFNKTFTSWIALGCSHVGLDTRSSSCMSSPVIFSDCALNASIVTELIDEVQETADSIDTGFERHGTSFREFSSIPRMYWPLNSVANRISTNSLSTTLKEVSRRESPTPTSKLVRPTIPIRCLEAEFSYELLTVCI